MAFRKYKGKKIEVAVNCSKTHNGKKGKITQVDIGEDERVTKNNFIKIQTNEDCIKIRIAGLLNFTAVAKELNDKEYVY